MASIDINKLIQESMTSTMEGTTEVVDDDINAKLAEAMAGNTVEEGAIGRGFRSLTGQQTVGDKLYKAKEKVKDAVGDAGEAISGAAGKVGKAVAGAAGKVKDIAADNPKTAAAAGAAGLIGAGFMAKKAMGSKKK